MTSSELAREAFATVEAKILGRPSVVEFEMAYQARVAIERIRFAIKLTEKALPVTADGHETGMQLLDALDRLESLDRRSRSDPESGRQPRVQQMAYRATAAARQAANRRDLGFDGDSNSSKSAGTKRYIKCWRRYD